ncbi:tetratricopeptide repeat protein [Streptomyces sp. NPDC001002]
MDERGTDDPRLVFAAALTRLRRRLPDVSDEALARRASAVALPSGRRVAVNARRLGEWLNGQSVPRQFEAVMALVLAMDRAVGGATGAQLGGTHIGMAQWQRLWRAAREHRNSGGVGQRIASSSPLTSNSPKHSPSQGQVGTPAHVPARIVIGRPPGDAAALRRRAELAERIDAGLLDRSVRQVLLTGAGGVGKSQLASAAFHRAKRWAEVLLWVPAGNRLSVLGSYARAWRALSGASIAGGVGGSGGSGGVGSAGATSLAGLAGDVVALGARDRNNPGGPMALAPAPSIPPAVVPSPDSAPGGDDETQADLFLTWLRSTATPWLVVLDDIDDPGELAGLWPAGDAGRTVLVTRRRDAALLRPGVRVIPVGVFSAAEATAYLTDRLRLDLGDVSDLSDAGPLGNLSDARKLGDAGVLGDAGALSNVGDLYDVSDADGLRDSGDPGDDPSPTAAHHGSPARYQPPTTHHTEPPSYPHPHQDLATLAALLGNFPLALSQAAAFLIDTGMDLPTYLGLLADRREQVAGLLPPSSPADEHGGTVTSTLQLALARAESLAPPGTARAMLELISMFAPDGIPDAVLLGSAARAWLGDGLDGGEVPERGSLLALRALHRLSLVTHHGPAPADGALSVVDVHSLVQRAVRDGVPADRRERLATAAADALEEVWPAPDRDPETETALYRSAEVLLAHADGGLWRGGDPRPLPGRRPPPDPQHPSGTHPLRDPYHLPDPQPPSDPQPLPSPQLPSGTHPLPDQRPELNPQSSLNARAPLRLHPLLRRFSPHLTALGRPGAARDMARALADQARRRLGDGHPDVLVLRAQAAQAVGDLGDTATALHSLTEIRREAEDGLGPVDPDTLSIRLHEARFRMEAGQIDAALAEFVALAAEARTTLTAGDPLVVFADDHVALCRGLSGDADGAREGYAALVRELERDLGPRHPTTLKTLTGLSRWIGETGDVRLAVTTYQQAVEGLAAVFGRLHPETLVARHNLAYWHGIAGELDEAIGQFVGAADDSERALGAEHPTTLTYRVNLAFWRGVAGDTAGALDQLERLQQPLEQVLGADHPRTLRTRQQRAELLYRRGDHTTAADQLTTLLADMVRIQGANHPRTREADELLTLWSRERTATTANLPNLDAPDLNAPNLDVPDLNAPNLDVPDLTAPKTAPPTAPDAHS